MAEFIITFPSLSGECKNLKVFTHSDSRIALGFAIKASIAATALKFINNARM